jgi:hypothetical protein
MVVLRARVEFLPSRCQLAPGYGNFRTRFFFRGQEWDCRSIEFEDRGCFYPHDVVDATISLSEYASEHLNVNLDDDDWFLLVWGKYESAIGLVTAIEHSP